MLTQRDKQFSTAEVQQTGGTSLPWWRLLPNVITQTHGPNVPLRRCPPLNNISQAKDEITGKRKHGRKAKCLVSCPHYIETFLNSVWGLRRNCKCLLWMTQSGGDPGGRNKSHQWNYCDHYNCQERTHHHYHLQNKRCKWG